MGFKTQNNAACAKCAFFDQQDAGASLGACRYNPPIEQPQSDSRGVWPKVEASDWCGHFQEA